MYGAPHPSTRSEKEAQITLYKNLTKFFHLTLPHHSDPALEFSFEHYIETKKDWLLRFLHVIHDKGVEVVQHYEGLDAGRTAILEYVLKPWWFLKDVRVPDDDVMGRCVVAQAIMDGTAERVLRKWGKPGVVEFQVDEDVEEVDPEKGEQQEEESSVPLEGNNAERSTETGVVMEEIESVRNIQSDKSLTELDADKFVQESSVTGKVSLNTGFILDANALKLLKERRRKLRESVEEKEEREVASQYESSRSSSVSSVPQGPRLLEPRVQKPVPESENESDDLIWVKTSPIKSPQEPQRDHPSAREAEVMSVPATPLKGTVTVVPCSPGFAVPQQQLIPPSSFYTSPISSNLGISSTQATAEECFEELMGIRPPMQPRPQVTTYPSTGGSESLITRLDRLRQRPANPYAGSSNPGIPAAMKSSAQGDAPNTFSSVFPLIGEILTPNKGVQPVMHNPRNYSPNPSTVGKSWDPSVPSTAPSRIPVPQTRTTFAVEITVPRDPRRLPEDQVGGPSGEGVPRSIGWPAENTAEQAGSPKAKLKPPLHDFSRDSPLPGAPPRFAPFVLKRPANMMDPREEGSGENARKKRKGPSLKRSQRKLTSEEALAEGSDDGDDISVVECIHIRDD